MTMRFIVKVVLSAKFEIAEEDVAEMKMRFPELKDAVESDFALSMQDWGGKEETVNVEATLTEVKP
jgi:hypothetical protein